MEYRFFLYHKDVGNWYRIKDPVGWDGIGRTIKRYGIDNEVGQKWHGLFYEYSAKIRFIKDGKNFIQKFKNIYGIEQEILLRIDTRDSQTRKFSTEYVGRISMLSVKLGAIYADASVENTGFIQKLKNALDVKVDLSKLVSQNEKAIAPFANESHSITLHSKVLRLTSKQSRQANVSILDTYEGGTGTRYVQMALEAVSDEIEESLTYIDGFNTNVPEDDGKYTIKFRAKSAGTTCSYNAKFRIKAKAITNGLIGGSDGITIKLYVAHKDKAGNISTASQTPINTTFATGSQYESAWTDVTMSGTLSAYENEEIYVYWEFFHLSGGSNREQELLFDLDSDNYFQVVCDSSFEESEANIILVHEAFTRVLQSVTDTPLPFYSEHFGRVDSEPIAYAADGEGSLRGITSGNQIRGIDKPIRCKLRDLVDTFAGLDGIGLGIEKVNGVERVRCEPLTHWFQTKLLMRLQYVKDIEKEDVADLYFNQMKIGPTEWASEKINNLDEVNAKREWTFPITQVKNELDLQTPYITGSYPIEFTRRARNEPTKDTRFDDNNFVLDLVRSGGGFAPTKDEAFSSVIGVISPETMYNLDLSPRRCIERNGRLIRAGLETQKDKYIKFADGEANLDMVSTKTGDIAKEETADIIISSLDKPLFLGEVYTVRSKLTKAQRDLLTVTDMSAAHNIFGFIEFSKTDKDFMRGYVLEARPASNSNEVVFRLLKANI